MRPTSTYTVRTGDTLWSIAATKLHDGNRWRELAQLNGLKSESITPGQELKLPNS
nr:LysM peptidoglycan-binding domain-containing protein [Streptomyces phaeochromogenes]